MRSSNSSLSISPRAKRSSRIRNAGEPAPRSPGCGELTQRTRSTTSTGLPDWNTAPRHWPISTCLYYARPAYLEGRGTPDRRADLGAHDLVVPRDLVATAALSLTSDRGRSEHPAIRPVIRTGELASVSRIVQAGGGIGPLPEIVAAPAVAAGALRRVLPAWTLGRARLHAISLGGREAPARVRLFRGFVRHELAALGAADIAPAP